MMNPAPIVLFTYNRPWHTMQTVDALMKNELAQESELFSVTTEKIIRKEVQRKHEKTYTCYRWSRILR